MHHKTHGMPEDPNHRSPASQRQKSALSQLRSGLNCYQRVGQDTQHGRDTNVLAQDATDAGDLKLSNVALRGRPVELKKVNRSRHKLNQCSMKEVDGGSETGRDNEEYYCVQLFVSV
jgi:hypothetical protein